MQWAETSNNKTLRHPEETEMGPNQVLTPDIKQFYADIMNI
jgi:hypothetical protein